MTQIPQPDRVPIGPDLAPGEAEQIRELARLAIGVTQATTNRDALVARMRALGPTESAVTAAREDAGWQRCRFAG